MRASRRIARRPCALLATAALLVAVASQAADSAKPADRAYRNGTIFTADSAHRSARALAIRDGKIVYVGADDRLGPWIGPSTELVDLHGSFLMMVVAGTNREPAAYFSPPRSRRC